MACATTQTLVAGFNMVDVGHVNLTDVCSNPGVESMFQYTPTASPADITVQVLDGLGNAVAQYTDCTGTNMLQCNPSPSLPITRWEGGTMFLLVNEPAFASGVAIQVLEVPVLPTGAACDPTGQANRCDSFACVDQGAGPVCL